ncbi:MULTISPECIES: hypothetical protein [unclassified Rhodococcus (in: high G+C Gram-positive bacteria)]|uniref:hypothetical protein n=1 Tax=unclassified Rhodococcus (in: high G+C Gram-positive bacteria) TaxID=192944 RepID=UPI001639AE4C|nr:MULTISPECIES: hypothetical protein [unclassified Rhodococcus (in: high G+C Gram-positive bacteria)]MBC2644822.1 hypothetical protein [Rhodococcus sp. 3A]MBC2890824.1 hypothetical protein [Rhodococcus sp. 4CII]
MNDSTAAITAGIVTAARQLDWGSIVIRDGRIAAVALDDEVEGDENLADHFDLCELAESASDAAIAAELNANSRD